MKTIALLALLVAACGTDNPTMPTDDAAIADAGMPATDGAIVPPVPGLVAVALDCQMFAREVHHVSTDGSRDVTINSYAATALTRADRFVLSRCFAPPPMTCSGADECSGELTPMASQICMPETVVQFFDGKLFVLCGTRTERYNASGTLTASTQTAFTMQLEVFQ